MPTSSRLLDCIVERDEAEGITVTMTEGGHAYRTQLPAILRLIGLKRNGLTVFFGQDDSSALHAAFYTTESELPIVTMMLLDADLAEIAGLGPNWANMTDSRLANAALDGFLEMRLRDYGRGHEETDAFTDLLVEALDWHIAEAV